MTANLNKKHTHCTTNKSGYKRVIGLKISSGQSPDRHKVCVCAGGGGGGIITFQGVKQQLD